MLEDFRNLERRYSLQSYPYADSEYSQQRLRALGIATDQLVTPPKNPVPETPVPLPPEPPKETGKGIQKLLPLVLGALLLFLFFRTPKAGPDAAR